MLFRSAAAYHSKRCSIKSDIPQLIFEACDDTVLCDVSLVDFLLEKLVDASLAVSASDVLHLEAMADGDFIRISLTNTSRSMSAEMLHTLFYPSRISNEYDGCLQGAEYIVCRQIIREHDAHFNHIGCRIKAETSAAGYTIWFTLPRKN